MNMRPWYRNGTASRGGMLSTALEWQGAPVRVADSLGRLLVSPTPATSANTAARKDVAFTHFCKP
jgi:hypothetical protein